MKKELTKAELETKAAEVLLGEGIKFEVKGLGKFTIKSLPLGIQAKIAKEAVKIEKTDSDTLYGVIASTALYAKPACKIVAIAILGTPLKVWLFSRILARRLFWKLTSKELHNLVTVIIEKSDPSFFFSCTSQLGAMRVMSPKVTKATTASGELLPG